MNVDSRNVHDWITKEQSNVAQDTIYKIKNHACLIIVYNHPTSLPQDQSVAVANTDFA